VLDMLDDQADDHPAVVAAVERFEANVARHSEFHCAVALRHGNDPEPVDLTALILASIEADPPIYTR
jgi:hypothetical protein